FMSQRAPIAFLLSDHAKKGVKCGGGGTHPVIELSRYVFEALRKDKEFILYRGRSEDHAPQAAFASRLRQATARPDSSEMQSAGRGHAQALAESGYRAP